MEFYRPRGHHQPAVLWNPETGTTVYEFIRGRCVTDDPDLIEKLTEMGFHTEPLSAQEQVLLDIAKDVRMAQPPPAPRTVPKYEPKTSRKKGEQDDAL